MSLLLDALKKAAEQKARKSKEEISGAETSDETIVVSAPEDISELDDTDRELQTQRDLQDQTEFDESRLQTQLEDTHLERDTDETIVETADTQLTDLSTQMQTGEDETIVFAEEDVSDFMGEPELVRRDAEDVTDLSQVTTHDDQTESQTRIEAGDEPAPGEDTEFDQTALQTRIDSTQVETDSDETEIDQTFHQTSIQADDADPTRTEVVDDLTESQEDMSLLLVERDDTHFTSRTSLTDPRQQAGQTRSDATETDGLGLVDTTRHQPPGEATETRSATQPGATAIDTQSTATRTESTGTYTYAPDNYDRTLMKLPSDDASRLFAGMKNDSEAVMTPDYAKKVFRSKSSAQRMHNAKIYGGIAIVIILAIGIFGAFEFQSESDQIDTSLRPLKRDPMPGLIKSGSQDQDTNLFAQPEPGVDTRAMEIIESAESAADTGEFATGSEAIDTTVAAVEPEVVITQPEPEVSQDQAQAQAQPLMEPAMDTEIASFDRSETPVSEPEGAASNLQISLSSRVEQKDIWLREAYAAYKSGNDELAMARYNQVLEIDPANRNALLARAAINVQNGNSRAAVQDYQALLLANPKDSLAMTSLITVANYSPRETESQLKLMIRDEPGSPHLNFALANVYGAQNRWQEAQGYYFRALQNNPGDPNYAYNLAVSLEHISQPASAITYYRRALANYDNGLATFSRDVVDQRLELLAKK